MSNLFEQPSPHPEGVNLGDLDEQQRAASEWWNALSQTDRVAVYRFLQRMAPTVVQRPVGNTDVLEQRRLFERQIYDLAGYLGTMLGAGITAHVALTKATTVIGLPLRRQIEWIVSQAKEYGLVEALSQYQQKAAIPTTLDKIIQLLILNAQTGATIAQSLSDIHREGLDRLR